MSKIRNSHLATVPRAMFALSVRSLDGSCRRLAVGPSLAEVRAQLDLGLPAFHEIKLFQGTRELADDALTP